MQQLNWFPVRKSVAYGPIHERYETNYPLPSESTLFQNTCRHKIVRTTRFKFEYVMQLNDFVHLVTAASDLFTVLPTV